MQDKIIDVLRRNTVEEALLQARADRRRAGGPQAGSPVPPPPSVGPPHFPADHWRHYAKTLESAFALLAPVAKRLGYPET